MAVPFPDIEPYEVLEVHKSSTPIEIKKSYKKLCLKYHPDKLKQQAKEIDNEVFAKIQFAYSILGDSDKRHRYDQTGSLSDFDLDGDEPGFSWKDFFDSINEGITLEMIEEDRAKYQGSREERQDIIQNFSYYEGDFLKLFEVIPHLEFDEAQEVRVFHTIEEAISSGEIKLDKNATKAWTKYVKSRKTKVKQMLKKLSKEAKEAEELEKELKSKGAANGGKRIAGGKESDLKALIQGRQAGRLDDLIGKLESKYGAQKKAKKRKVAESHDIDDEEFERIQRGFKRK